MPSGCLNRTCTGKDDTFILDFVNKSEEILELLQPYYRAAQLRTRKIVRVPREAAVSAITAWKQGD